MPDELDLSRPGLRWASDPDDEQVMTVMAPRAGPAGTRSATSPSGAHVLVVDDEASVAEIIAYALEGAGHRVTRAATGPDALVRMVADPADLVVLDLMLPGMGGMDVLRELRRTSRVPVILVSAIADVAERVVGLELGADDYVTKPFSPRELTARVQSILRRMAPVAGQDVLVFDGLRIDVKAREAHVEGREVALTTKEFDLLAFLAASPREVFTREQLLRRVWGSTSDWQDPATVTEHVRRIRLKIEADPTTSHWISTIRGAGYRFEA